jgi:hypothetical protein
MPLWCIVLLFMHQKRWRDERGDVQHAVAEWERLKSDGCEMPNIKQEGDL